MLGVSAPAGRTGVPRLAGVASPPYWRAFLSGPFEKNFVSAQRAASATFKPDFDPLLPAPTWATEQPNRRDLRGQGHEATELRRRGVARLRGGLSDRVANLESKIILGDSTI